MKNKKTYISKLKEISALNIIDININLQNQWLDIKYKNRIGFYKYNSTLNNPFIFLYNIHNFKINNIIKGLLCSKEEHKIILGLNLLCLI